MTWQLRTATLDDLDLIMELERATFTSDAWSRESMAAEIDAPHTRYLVAEPATGGPLVAYAGLSAPERASQADIQTIAVAEHARRGGLGRALMQQLMTEARQRGATEIFLEVRADNPGAQRLYELLGFEVIGVRPRYYQPDGVDAHVMRAPLPAPHTTPALSSFRNGGSGSQVGPVGGSWERGATFLNDESDDESREGRS